MGAPNIGQAVALDLQTLESFDPNGGRGTGTNRRFCCPLCGIEKPRDAAHRCLSLDARGLWNCKRCGESGKLRDFWEQRDAPPKATGRNWQRGHAQRQRAELSRLRDDAPQTELETGANWRDKLPGLVPLPGTPGAAYLSGRGVPLDVASLAGARFSSDWFGRASVVFSIRDNAGKLVAAQGRRVKPTTGPTALTIGPKSRGAFMAPARVGGQTFGPLDPRGPGVIICEAPIDALSLAACGVPALALCGINGAATTGPAWLPLACGLKSVWLAFDADDAGDDAATALTAKLGTYGARCERLRPETGKDWNEALLAVGRDALICWLTMRLNPTPGAPGDAATPPTSAPDAPAWLSPELSRQQQWRAARLDGQRQARERAQQNEVTT